MGDMADYLLEQVEEFEAQRYLYERGEISFVDAIEMGLIDDDGGGI